MRAQGHEPRRNRRAQIQHDLARLGVATEACESLARRLEALEPTLSPDAYRAALTAAALAEGMHAQERQALQRSVRELREMERLLDAFSDEMRKLDEALQTLAAYVERMRSQAPEAEPQTLH